MGRPNQAARLQGAGGCDVFYAVASYVRNGAQLCDIVNPDGALVYVGCTVVNGQSNKINAPSPPWAGDLLPGKYPLVVAMYRSLGRAPIVLGKVDNASINYTSGAVASDEDDDAVITKTELGDVAIANDKSKLVFKDTNSGGDIVIEPERNLKVQLADGASMRVSSGGDASDGPVLAAPYVSRDDEIVTLLKQIVEWINTMTATQGRPAFPPFEGALGILNVDLADVKSAVLALSSKTGG